MMPANVMEGDPLASALHEDVRAITRGGLIAAMSRYTLGPLDERLATQVTSRYRAYSHQLTETATETLLLLRAQGKLDSSAILSVPAKILANQAARRAIETDQRFFHEVGLSRRSMNRASRFVVWLTRPTLPPSALLASNQQQTFSDFIEQRQQDTASLFMSNAREIPEAFDVQTQHIPQAPLNHAITQTLSTQLTEEQLAICDARVEFLLRNGWASQQIPGRSVQR